MLECSVMIHIGKRILSAFGSTNAKYGLIKDGDKVLIGLSGGKDSILLVTLIARLQKIAPFKFECHAVTVDYGRGGEYDYIYEYCKRIGMPYTLKRTNAYQLMSEKTRAGSVYCSFCSRIRRGTLYSSAKELGCNKLALAHHLDDAAESFVMNFIHNGALRSMPPYYISSEGIEVIRPLIFVRERQIIDFIASNNIYIAPDCNCPINWLPEDKRPSARRKAKEMLQNIERENPM